MHPNLAPPVKVWGLLSFFVQEMGVSIFKIIFPRHLSTINIENFCGNHVANIPLLRSLKQESSFFWATPCICSVYPAYCGLMYGVLSWQRPGRGCRLSSDCFCEYHKYNKYNNYHSPQTMQTDGAAVVATPGQMRYLQIQTAAKNTRYEMCRMWETYFRVALSSAPQLVHADAECK